MIRASSPHLLRQAIALMNASHRMVQIVVRDGQWTLTLQQQRGDRVRAHIAGDSLEMLDKQMYLKSNRDIGHRLTVR